MKREKISLCYSNVANFSQTNFFFFILPKTSVLFAVFRLTTLSFHFLPSCDVGKVGGSNTISVIIADNLAPGQYVVPGGGVICREHPLMSVVTSW